MLLNVDIIEIQGHIHQWRQGACPPRYQAGGSCVCCEDVDEVRIGCMCRVGTDVT